MPTCSLTACPLAFRFPATSLSPQARAPRASPSAAWTPPARTRSWTLTTAPWAARPATRTTTGERAARTPCQLGHAPCSSSRGQRAHSALMWDWSLLIPLNLHPHPCAPCHRHCACSLWTFKVPTNCSEPAVSPTHPDGECKEIVPTDFTTIPNPTSGPTITCADQAGKPSRTGHRARLMGSRGAKAPRQQECHAHVQCRWLAPEPFRSSVALPCYPQPASLW